MIDDVSPGLRVKSCEVLLRVFKLIAPGLHHSTEGIAGVVVDDTLGFCDERLKLLEKRGLWLFADRLFSFHMLQFGCR